MYIYKLYIYAKCDASSFSGPDCHNKNAYAHAFFQPRCEKQHVLWISATKYHHRRDEATMNLHFKELGSVMLG